ncbi:MAG TPA: NADPH-dependent FMN reductase [Bacillota bacterium]|nr:NADPH-dependent FMN reductase [Bacillota bacterium]
MKLVGVAGSLVGDKTAQAVYDVLATANQLDSSIQIELIDLRDYDVEFAIGQPLAYYNNDTWDVVSKVLDADFLVFGTPIYQASMTGALKNLFDHLPMHAFSSKVTGIVATAGSEKHYLVSEYQLKSILTYLKGFVPVNNVFIHNDSFNENDKIVDDDVHRRIQKLAEEMVFLQQSIYNRK